MFVFNCFSILLRTGQGHGLCESSPGLIYVECDGTWVERGSFEECWGGLV
jgi:hypothetical protein